MTIEEPYCTYGLLLPSLPVPPLCNETKCKRSFPRTEELSDEGSAPPSTISVGHRPFSTGLSTRRERMMKIIVVMFENAARYSFLFCHKCFPRHSGRHLRFVSSLTGDPFQRSASRSAIRAGANTFELFVPERLSLRRDT